MDYIIEIIGHNRAIIKIAVIAIGYLLTFLITNKLIKRFIIEPIDPSDHNKEKDPKLNQKKIRDGFIIGKCENIIIITLVLVDEVTGLSLIFAAKSLARQKAINDDAGFFLAGTMVNFTASFLMAYFLKFILAIIEKCPVNS